MNYGRHLDAVYGVERRYPFRDRELAEFMLAVPTDQLFWRGVSRPIVRTAFSNDMPSSVLNRVGKTDFSSYVDTRFNQDTRIKKLKEKKTFFNSQVDLTGMTAIDEDASSQSLLRWSLAYYEWWKSLCYTPTLQGLASGSTNSEKN